MREEKICLADVKSAEKESSEDLNRLVSQVLKSLQELVQELRVQNQVECDRNNLLTELLADNQLMRESLLSRSAPIGGHVIAELDEDGNPILDLDGKPLAG